MSFSVTSASPTLVDVLRRAVDTERLNEYYATNVIGDSLRRSLVAQYASMDGFRRPCYITTGALAWVATGRDAASPFSEVWDDAVEGVGEGVRVVIGYEDAETADEDPAAFDHVACVAGDVAFDSCWRRWTAREGLFDAARWRTEYARVAHLPLPDAETTPTHEMLARLDAAVSG